VKFKEDEALQLERGHDHRFDGEVRSELLSETRLWGYSDGATHFLELDLSYTRAVVCQSLISFFPNC